jgi:ribonuclease-3
MGLGTSAPSGSKRDFTALERAIGHKFRARDLLQTAITHSSHAHENSSRVAGSAGLSAEWHSQPNGSPTAEADNERLEFLGDAVLGLVTSEELVARFPELHEGQLSKLRARLVSQHHLVTVAEQLQLGSYLRLGRGEEKSGGRSKAALLVDALEAVIGAMYLDGGLDAVRPFVKATILAVELQARAAGSQTLTVSDYKSALQEAAHALGRVQPSYVLVEEEGPPHKRTFTVEVRVHRGTKRGRAEYVARAKGGTKKMAEQNAARDALAYLNTTAEVGSDTGKLRAARRADAPASRGGHD